MPLMPPEDFELLENSSGFSAHNGPCYYRRDSEYEFGFLSDERHANRRGVLHGGAIMGFLDISIGNTVRLVTGSYGVTVALNSRFTGNAATGSWITARTLVKRITGTLAFVDGEVFAGDKLVAVAGAVFRVFSPHK